MQIFKLMDIESASQSEHTHLFMLFLCDFIVEKNLREKNTVKYVKKFSIFMIYTIACKPILFPPSGIPLS